MTDIGNVTPSEAKEITKQEEKAKYEVNVNSYLIELETDPLGLKSNTSFTVIVIIVILIIIFTSVFCIKNSFDISVTEKIRDYGMLRSVGATKKQIKKCVFYEGTILGLIGIPLGILFGHIASYILIIISNILLKGNMSEAFKLVFTFNPWVILFSIILGIITIYLSSIRSARKTSKITPIDSIRNNLNIEIKPNSLKTPKFIKSIFKEGGVISYKNIKRNKKKYRSTTLSIIVSVAVFIALSEFMYLTFDMTKSTLDLSEFNIVLYDSTNDNSGGQSMSDELYNKYIETTNLDDVKEASLVRSEYINDKNIKYTKAYKEKMGMVDGGGSIEVKTLGKVEYLKYIKSLGLRYDDTKDKGILIDLDDEPISDEGGTHKEKTRVLNVDEGDTIRGKTSKNGVEVSIPIIKYTTNIPFGLKGDSSTGYLIISDELYDKIAPNNNLVVYYNAKDADKLEDEINKIVGSEHYSLTNIAKQEKIANNVYLLISIFLYGFIIVISLIGITNIFNTITTNMEFNKREYAMLKSVGMSKNEFDNMINLEGLFIGIKGLTIGIVIGIILSYILYSIYHDGYEAMYIFPYKAILISIIVVLLLIGIIMKYSINKINKQNIIETIRDENI